MERKMDSLSSMLLFIFAFLCLTSSTYSQNPGIPRVTYEGDSLVVEGDPFRITCRVTLFDSVKWQKDGRTLYPDIYNNITLTEESTGGTVLATLSVSYANIFHTGSYKCNSFTNESLQIYVLNANPSPTDPIYVPVKYKQKQALLPCPIREQKPLVLKWKKEESLIAIGEGEHKHLSVSTDEHGATLIIATPGEKDLGNYSCQLYNPGNYSAVEGMTKYFVVMSDLTIKLEEASTVIEGEKLKIRCLVTSKTPPHRIAWQFGNNTYDESRNRVELSPDERDIPNAIFKIDVAVMEDRGTYTCLAYATAASNATTAETFVRVKDKYAALWPFLGICAEVVVLCAIILIYEKKRNKAELEESDTDQSPDQKNTPDLGKESVRQRK